MKGLLAVKGLRNFWNFREFDGTWLIGLFYDWIFLCNFYQLLQFRCTNNPIILSIEPFWLPIRTPIYYRLPNSLSFSLSQFISWTRNSQMTTLSCRHQLHWTVIACTDKISNLKITIKSVQRFTTEKQDVQFVWVPNLEPPRRTNCNWIHPRKPSSAR